jgi:oligopeptide/dipeptide ABC transporter ATP-binding protein
LLRSRADYRLRGGNLNPIGGSMPEMDKLPAGCVFHPRCAHHQPGRCDMDEPNLADVAERRHVRCVRWRELFTAPL